MATVFVYGTFMPGEQRWPILEPFAEAVQSATAKGQLWDTGREYPAAKFAADGDDVPGVLVTLRPDRADDALRQLDEIEGEGVLYRRITVETSGGPATTYEWIVTTDGMRVLPRGWLPFG